MSKKINKPRGKAILDRMVDIQHRNAIEEQLERLSTPEEEAKQLANFKAILNGMKKSGI